MAKIAVTLPSGYSNMLVVDSKDFITLVEIFERSNSVEQKYVGGDYVHVVRKPFELVGTTSMKVVAEETLEALKQEDAS